jgi:hypothetical protein
VVGTLAAILGVGAALLVGCGGDESGLIPGRNGRALLSDLSAVRDRVAARNCIRTASALARLEEELDRLPEDIDPRLRERLVSGVARLTRRALRECQRTPTQATTPTVTETTTTTPPTTETVPPTTTMAPPPTATAPPTATTPPTTTTGTGGTAVPTVTTP